MDDNVNSGETCSKKTVRQMTFIEKVIQIATMPFSFIFPSHKSCTDMNARMVILTMRATYR